MAPSLRRSLTGLTATGLVVGGSLLFVTTAGATPPVAPAVPDGAIALHNSSAGSEADCPDDGAAYWHFVLAPNDGSAAFTSISLELATPPSGSEVVTFGAVDILPNGTQTDNVFVAVPEGHVLTDLMTGPDSYAYVSGATPKLFNLSHVCDGGVPSTTPEETTPTTAPEETTPTTATGPEDVGTATAVPAADQPEVLGAVQVNGELPYTGSNDGLLAVAGLSVLTGGAALVLMARKGARHTEGS